MITAGKSKKPNF